MAQSDLNLAGAKVVLASKAEAAKFLGTEDQFVKVLSPFDRAARLKSEKPVDQAEYLQFVSQQALDWSEAERQSLTEDIRAIDQKLKSFKLNLPETVLLIKTTGQEEGGAAYTRGPAIILPQSKSVRRGQTSLLLHELFHVLSRHDAALREKLYGIIGFRQCGELELPADRQPLRMTNPDGPFNNHCIEIKHEGQSRWAMPILFSKTNYNLKTGGEFFVYMNFKLILVESPEADKPSRPLLANGQPILLDPKSTEGFLSQIGSNTGYIIHPDEVLADNFVMVVNGRQDVANPELLTKIAECLK